MFASIWCGMFVMVCSLWSRMRSFSTFSVCLTQMSMGSRRSCSPLPQSRVLGGVWQTSSARKQMSTWTRGLLSLSLLLLCLSALRNHWPKFLVLLSFRPWFVYLCNHYSCRIAGFVLCNALGFHFVVLTLSLKPLVSFDSVAVVCLFVCQCNHHNSRLASLVSSSVY